MRTKKKYYGGNKLNSLPKPKLGHPWTGNPLSWPGIYQQSSQSCNGITQSNYLPTNTLGMGPGLPIATNTLHGGKRKKKTMRNKTKCNKTKCNKTKRSKTKRSKTKRSKTKRSKTKRNYKGGGMSSFFPESILNLGRSIASFPHKFSNTWNGHAQPNNLNPYPVNQPIGKNKDMLLDVGYKLKPKEVQSMATDKTFS